MPIETAPQLPDFNREVHCLLGLPIDAVDVAGAERRIRLAAENRSPCFLSTPNVNFLIACRSDDSFRSSVINSDLSVADGMPLVWLAKLLGVPIRERVAGATLFDALRHGGGKPLSVYFFGGPDGVAESAGRQLALESRGLTCVGYESPGFGTVEDMSADSVIQRINASDADVLVVSLGARKGQAWIERNRKRLSVPVITHLGAVLHFAAKSLRRAPVWMQDSGLEWLWRVREEPGLWRRYWHDGLALLALLITRVLPHLWHTTWHRPGADEPAVSKLQTGTDEEAYELHLRGAWTRSNIVRLRRLFYHAALSGKDIKLEMAGVTRVDSAFIGLVMLLQGYQQQRGKQLLIASLPKTVRRFIQYCGAEFLCSGLTAVRAPDMGIHDAILSDHAPSP
jgi:N-acetylglucosaminyldiphosphoundecaprenol N-acetyl-beta-D-mannosaminyltransferase